MLKRWVFNARRKEGCESMSLMSVGRLFQTSGLLTENARRLNCVLVRRTTAVLVVDDHSWRWCALGLNATRSLRYGGEHWWNILYINVATLKVIRNFIGSQWSCLRVGVMWDRRLRPRMGRALSLCFRLYPFISRHSLPIYCPFLCFLLPSSFHGRCLGWWGYIRACFPFCSILALLTFSSCVINCYRL